MAQHGGHPQFPDAVRVILRAAAVLEEAWYVPLSQWESTPSTGGLTRKGGKTIADTPHVDLSQVSESDFETLWALMDYTLEFSRGARARPEKAQFRKSGKLLDDSRSRHVHRRAPSETRSRRSSRRANSSTWRPRRTTSSILAW